MTEQDDSAASDVTRETPLIVRADSGDVPALAAMLARAFTDDPFVSWLTGPAGDEAERARLFATVLQRLILPHGEAYTTRDRAGAALWTPPLQWHMNSRDQLSFVPIIADIAGLLRVPEVWRGLAQIEEHHPREPHYYLLFLGVDPGQQGRGIGSALMRPVLGRCDAQGTPAYLETANERTLRLYDRHGFVLRAEVQVTHGPRLWCLWRDPA